jgi:transposase
MEKIINLHGMTQDDIKRNIRKSKDIREIERWICINSSLKGLSPPIIADILNRDEKTIREWINNFNEEGITGIKRVSPPGKKKESTKNRLRN